MTAERILGFVLIAAGLVLIAYAVSASVPIFRGAAFPPEIFSAPEERPREPRKIPSAGQMENLLAEQIGSILPAETIPKVLNLGSWVLFAGLLLAAGGQVAGIGVRLVKR